MIRFCSFCSSLVLIAVVAACSRTPPVEPATLVLRNGNIITVNAQAPRAQALAIRGDRIVAVGSESDIQSYISQATEVIDLAGQTAIPGFIEGHGHFMGLGQAQMVVPRQFPALQPLCGTGRHRAGRMYQGKPFWSHRRALQQLFQGTGHRIPLRCGYHQYFMRPVQAQPIPDRAFPISFIDDEGMAPFLLVQPQPEAGIAGVVQWFGQRPRDVEHVLSTDAPEAGGAEAQSTSDQ